MQVSLTETLEAYVRDRVASGLYGDASEVIRAALRAQIAAEQTDAALRAQIDIGWTQAERGAFVPFDPDQIGRDLDAELASLNPVAARL